MEKIGQNTSIRGFWGRSFEYRHQNLILFTRKLNNGVYNLKLRQKIGIFFSCKRTSKVKMPLNHTQSSFIGAQIS